MDLRGRTLLVNCLKRSFIMLQYSSYVLTDPQYLIQYKIQYLYNIFLSAFKGNYTDFTHQDENPSQRVVLV